MEGRVAPALRLELVRAALDLGDVRAGLLQAVQVVGLLAGGAGRRAGARRAGARAAGARAAGPGAVGARRRAAEAELLARLRELAQRPRARRGGDRLGLVEVRDRELERDPAALQVADLGPHVLRHVELDVERELAQRLVVLAAPDVDGRALDRAGDVAPLLGGQRLRHGAGALDVQALGLRQQPAHVVEELRDVDLGAHVLGRRSGDVLLTLRLGVVEPVDRLDAERAERRRAARALALGLLGGVLVALLERVVELRADVEGLPLERQVAGLAGRDGARAERLAARVHVERELEGWAAARA